MSGGLVIDWMSWSDALNSTLLCCFAIRQLMTFWARTLSVKSTKLRPDSRPTCVWCMTVTLHAVWCPNRPLLTVLLSTDIHAVVPQKNQRSFYALLRITETCSDQQKMQADTAHWFIQHWFMTSVEDVLTCHSGNSVCWLMTSKKDKSFQILIQFKSSFVNFRNCCADWFCHLCTLWFCDLCMWNCN